MEHKIFVIYQIHALKLTVILASQETAQIAHRDIT